MKKRIAILIVFIALVATARLCPSPCAPIAFAEPHAQATAPAPTPTEEPTKAPYVFPTPIFIPIYPDDTPVPRATPGTRPTGQPTGEQTHTVVAGDSLWIIAQKMYGDGTKYPLIMAANNLTSTTRLRVGTVLVIPPLSGTAPPTATSAPLAPTPAPPTLEPTLAPTVPAPTPRPSPTPASWVPTLARGAVSLGINVLSGLLLVTSILSAIMAYLMYLRARRLERLASGKQPLRIQK
jgi:LysM repeat protein